MLQCALGSGNKARGLGARGEHALKSNWLTEGALQPHSVHFQQFPVNLNFSDRPICFGISLPVFDDHPEIGMLVTMLRMIYDAAINACSRQIAAPVVAIKHDW